MVRWLPSTSFNGGIGLPALMALMGHVTPEMTLRYAKLASPTIRTAYQTAMDKIRLTPSGKPRSAVQGRVARGNHTPGLPRNGT